ncbi:hypothetical protein [Thalassospira aquimaris]|uniref:Uncharacterized protein n=1 Tax=Thalassospira aquimaris TaxID=3037796 RepID=A0ABT6GHS7_9PROT|nr:hypothetical protein [Thalassospira sp. FZY0004]MDG4721579.1 hypothetical protein [Thalassospira sp. FZY0004]
MKRLFGIALAAVLFLWLSFPIAASPVCGDRAKVLDSLAKKYSEEPVAVGVTSSGGVIEVLKAPGGQTWTILFTYPNGPSCLVASGEAWQELEDKLKGPAA